MDRLINSLILGFIAAAGFILLLFGFRGSAIKDKKIRKFFFISLFVFFSLPGCRADQESSTQSQRILQLNETREWQLFKAFWKELDQVEPSSMTLEGEEGEIYTYRNFLDPFSWERNQRHEILEEHVQNLIDLELLSQNEIELLQLICAQRISFLFEIDRLFTTRLAPPPIYYRKAQTLEQLELKIDGISALYQDNLIDDGELNMLLEEVIEEIHNLLILAVIMPDAEYNFDYFSIELPSGNSVENHIAFFDEYLDRQFPQGRVDRKTKEILNNLDKINGTIHTLSPLVQDLIIPE